MAQTRSPSATASAKRADSGRLSNLELNTPRNPNPSRICAPRISMRVSSSAIFTFSDSFIEFQHRNGAKRGQTGKNVSRRAAEASDLSQACIDGTELRLSSVREAVAAIGGGGGLIK